MPNSISLMSYQDVKEILERALGEKDGLKLTFETKGGAIYWLSRANSFRRLDRKNNLTLYPEGNSLHGCSPYDVLLMKRVGEKDIEVRVRTNERIKIEQL